MGENDHAVNQLMVLDDWCALQAQALFRESVTSTNPMAGRWTYRIQSQHGECSVRNWYHVPSLPLEKAP